MARENLPPRPAPSEDVICARASGGVSVRGPSDDAMEGQMQEVLAYMAKVVQPESSSPAWLTWYDGMVKAHPLAVNSATALIGMGLGDLVAQLGASGHGHFDPVRWLRMASFGVLLAGPLCYKFYEWIDAAVYPERRKENGVVVLKMAIDQLLWSPSFTCVFFAYTCLLRGDPGGTLLMIQERLAPTMCANWLLWPAAHLVNFKVVPPNMRILYVMAVNVVWNVFLSIISNQPQLLASTFGRLGISI